MFAWLDFAIALLKLVNAIFSYAERKSWIDEGRRQVIVETLVSIADKLKIRDQIRAKVDAMSDADVDRGLRDLEPK